MAQPNLLSAPPVSTVSGRDKTLGSNPHILGNAVNAVLPSTPNSQLQGSAQYNRAGQPLAGTAASANAPVNGINFGAINVTPVGGAVFHPAVAQGYTAPAHATPQLNAVENSGLSSYVTGSQTPTPNGGSITTNAAGGVSNYTPASQFTIDTSGPVPSSALSSTLGMGDLAQKKMQYQDYVNGVAQANGYSPAYLQAQQQQYQAQAQAAALGFDQAQLNSNFYTGNNLPGDTLGYAQGATARAAAQTTLEQAQNTMQQTQAGINLNTQQLARTGNIAAAQTQLQYNPTALSGLQAITQYNSLQQMFPGANIPSYDTNFTPQENQQIASQLVSGSPAYQAGFSSTYTTPGGGTGIFSKLNMNGFQKNADGSYTLVPAAAAALGAANAQTVQDKMSQLSTINSAIEASGKTVQTMTNFMNQYGLNQSDIPIVNQIANSTNAQLPKAGALAALKVDLNTLRSDYSQFLIGRGGSVAGTNVEAQNAIPDNISPAQLQLVYSQMKQGGQNTADSVSAQVNQALQGIQTNTNASTNGASSGGINIGSSWANIGG